MLRAIIVDDEQSSQETLAKLLEIYCSEITITGFANNVEQAFTLIKEQKPDIVFLDVEMPNGSGFDLLALFDNIPFEIIFVTAYDQYALKAIKFCALDYLLKPVNAEELIKSVQKLSNKKVEELTQLKFRTLLENLQVHNVLDNRIAIPCKDGMEFIQVKEIVRCEADGRYTAIFLKDKPSKLTTQNLKEFENLLEQHQFFRVHHSHLINLNYVNRYRRGEGGYVIMDDGTSVDVSRRKRDLFLERLGMK